MRSPTVKHPKPKRLCPEADRTQLPSEPTYIGSPEHKNYPFGDYRRPTPRPDATLCPHLALDQVQTWLNVAFEMGNYSLFQEGGFPRYAWAEIGDQWYEARLTNQVLGQYKGYPILEAEVPVTLRRTT